MKGICCNVNHINIINTNSFYKSNYKIDIINNNKDKDMFVLIFND